MIIVVCTDDDKLVQVAIKTAQADQGTYGKVYQVFQKQIPQLSVAEDLFISAHGAYEGDDNNPVIGDKAAALFVNAVEFMTNLGGIFPVGYRGRIFVSACESADHDDDDMSFAEVLLTQVQAKFGQVRVFGERGGVGLRVPPPADKAWVEATL